MSDGLVKRLRTVDISWSEVGEWCGEAADLLDECERAFEFIARGDCGCDECNKAREMLTKLRAQEKVDE